MPYRTRTRVRYGSRRAQVGELWLPPVGSAPPPVVVLIHGGFWRAAYTKRLMHRLAAAIRDEGFAVWNIEYRRVGPGGGGGGWPETLDDVASAIDHLTRIPDLDVGRVVTCGHSAGGHLALWAAGRPRLPDGAPGAGPAVTVGGGIALGGVVDLGEAAVMQLGGGAVGRLLGGSPAAEPERYRLASPAALLPLGLPQILIHGDADAAVPLTMAQHYQEMASAAGDAVELVTLPGTGHMELIEPRGRAWEALRRALHALRA